MKSSWQRKPSKTLTGSQVLDERRRLKATVNIQGQMLTLAQLKLVLASCDSLPGLGFETDKDHLSHNIGRRGGRALPQIQLFSTGHRSSRCAMESSRPWVENPFPGAVGVRECPQLSVLKSEFSLTSLLSTGLSIDAQSPMSSFTPRKSTNHLSV
jgi:hypothetical protein